MDTFKEIINPIEIGCEIHSVSFNNENILACGLYHGYIYLYDVES